MMKPPPKPEEKLQRDLFVAIQSMPHAEQRIRAAEIIAAFFAALKPLPRPTRH